MERGTISKQILIDADPARIFDALTQPAEIVLHYPVLRVESDLRVGGKVHYHGEYEGRAFTDYGTIEAFERGKAYRYRYWSDNHGTEPTPANHMTITYVIEPAANGATLHVTHGNTLPGAYHDTVEAMWDGVLLALKSYVEAG